MRNPFRSKKPIKSNKINRTALLCAKKVSRLHLQTVENISFAALARQLHCMLVCIATHQKREIS